MRLTHRAVAVARVDTKVQIQDPLVTPPIHAVYVRPAATPPPPAPGQKLCGMVFDQVLDPGAQAAIDGATVTFVSDNPDGTATVRIERR